jgi:hypothetical protein
MSVAASPQQVVSFLAQPEYLEKVPKKNEIASVTNTHQAITDLFINAVWSSAEGKSTWSYTFSPLVPLWHACGHLYVYFSRFNKNCGKSV